ncbi:class IV adenylate cyclase [Vibrio sp. VB16]|uniref:class IV adenylate cyclase n=1 Tax=Vibrio sp. VB16 TaxID=2785746 RepID=UPI00189C9442|nr:class IV adenylate cyclase [Vibrio sp. VB16]UGA53380.1 class IV adenylate cyclase [Vibrio sp. VB16]
MNHEHFKGKFEVELKYRIASKSEFLEVLESMEHEVMLQDNVESDWYFDTCDHDLKSQNKSLCIREMEPSGIKLWIVKGPEEDCCQATNITDANNARQMLNTLGYDVVLKLNKIRSIYFVDKFHITVDHLHGLGEFAEFAIMTDDAGLLEGYRTELIGLASKFGLTDTELEHKPYRCLQLEEHEMD